MHSASKFKKILLLNFGDGMLICRAGQ